MHRFKDVQWEKLFYAAVLGGFGLRSVIVIFSDSRLAIGNVFTSVHAFVVMFCFYGVFYLMRND